MNEARGPLEDVSQLAAAHSPSSSSHLLAAEPAVGFYRPAAGSARQASIDD